VRELSSEGEGLDVSDLLCESHLQHFEVFVSAIEIQPDPITRFPKIVNKFNISLFRSYVQIPSILHRLLKQRPQLLPLHLQILCLQTRRQHQHSRLRDRALHQPLDILCPET
jgi:hypothetical protein